MSANLNLPQLTENQANPEITVNDVVAQIDAVLTETLAADVTSGNVVVTSAQFRAQARINIINATTGGRTVTVPAVKRYFLVTGDAANTVTAAVVCGSTSISVSPGETRFFFTDGTTNGLTSFAIGSTFDIAAFFPGLQVNNQLLFLYIADRPFTLPLSLVGSKAKANTPPADGTAVITLKKNGSSIGSINFAVTTGAVTFTFAAAVSFAVDDVFSMHGQASHDSAMADVATNLKGSR